MFVNSGYLGYHELSSQLEASGWLLLISLNSKVFLDLNEWNMNENLRRWSETGTYNHAMVKVTEHFTLCQHFTPSSYNPGLCNYLIVHDYCCDDVLQVSITLETVNCTCAHDYKMHFTRWNLPAFDARMNKSCAWKCIERAASFKQQPHTSDLSCDVVSGAKTAHVEHKAVLRKEM